MKQALTANWQRRDLSDLPMPLAEVWRELAPATQADCRYETAPFALDTPLQHWAHILHIPAAGKTLVIWRGKGVRQDNLVAIEGKPEAVKRGIEAGRISSVPAQRPFRAPRPARSKAAPKPAIKQAAPLALPSPRRRLPAPQQVEKQ